MTNYIRAALIVTAGTIAAILLTFAPRAHAADGPICMSWDSAKTVAKDKWGELPSYQADSSQGGVLVITINPKTNTWTLWLMPSASMACAIGAGTGWEPAPPSVVAPPAPSTPAPDAKPIEPQMYTVPGQWGDRYLLRTVFLIS